MQRPIVVLVVLSAVLASCRTEPVEPLVERLDSAQSAPETWTLVDTEIRDDCSPMAGKQCPGVLRTWRTDEPEADVRGELEDLFPDAQVESSFESCGPDTSDCYATLQFVTDGFGARIQAVRFDGTTEATVLVYHD